jgi:hypothetical protein
MGVYYLFVFCSAGNWTQGLVLAFTTEKYALPPQCISWLSTLFYWFIFSATALHSFDFNIFHITLNIFLLSCDSYSIWIQRLLNSSIFKITIGNVILINLYNFHIAVILYTFFFFFGCTGFALSALCLLGKGSTTWTILPVLLCFSSYSCKVSHFCPSLDSDNTHPASLVQFHTTMSGLLTEMVFNFLPWLASNHDPSDLWLPSSWDYKCNPLHLVLFLSFYYAITCFTALFSPFLEIEKTVTHWLLFQPSAENSIYFLDLIIQHSIVWYMKTSLQQRFHHNAVFSHCFHPFINK